MAEKIEYISQDLRPSLRRQAWRVWAVGLAVVTGWVLLIVAAPVSKANGFLGFSLALYGFFSFICHQIADRSFYIFGEQFAVCSRCFGVYLGLVVGFSAYPLWRKVDAVEPPRRFWLFLSLIPITIDWSLTFFGIWENTQASRFVTGLILGIACGTFIVPAIVEIARNLKVFTADKRR